MGFAICNPHAPAATNGGRGTAREAEQRFKRL
jgi:hypothetical protein